MNISRKRLAVYAELAKHSYDIPQVVIGETGIYAEFTGGELRIAYSGTDSFDDVVADVSFWPKNGEHNGFARYANECLIPTINLINGYCGGHPYFISLVGHSLGGAIAQIIAKRLQGQFKHVNVFTFGSPRVFTRWAQPKNISHYRVFNNADPVTKLLPLMFKHNESDFLEIDGFGISLDAHELGTYIKELEK
jgi:hypothetical protein